MLEPLAGSAGRLALPCPGPGASQRGSADVFEGFGRAFCAWSQETLSTLVCVALGNAYEGASRRRFVRDLARCPT